MPNTNPAADTANWTPITAAAWDGQSEYPQGSYATVSVLGQTRLVRAITTISAPVATPNAAPASDTTRWDALSDSWNGNAAYGQGVYVTRSIAGQLRLFRSLGNIAAPSATYNEIARWNIAGGSSNTAGSADYYTQGTGSGILDGSLFANRTPVSTTLPNTSGFLTVAGLQALQNNGTIYRLRAVDNAGGTNGLPAGKSGVATGQITTMDTSPFGSGSRIAFIVGSAELMRNGFGDPTTNIYQGGGTWRLEQQTASTPNTAPEDDSANWEEITPPAHDGNVAYAEDTVVESGGLFYESNTAIPLPTAQPNTSPASAPTQWAFPATPNWDENASYNEDDHVRYSGAFYRALAAISAPSQEDVLTTEGGDTLLTESGDELILE